jgi:4,5-dihydroxyphthalate decarboxylase
MEPGEDLGDLVVAGELAAAIGVEHDGLVPLIADAEEAGFAALRERGHYPINHLVVVKDELLEVRPQLAGAVFDAFQHARDLYVRRGELEPLHRKVTEITGEDPLPYGLEPNRATIEELIEHALNQNILARRPSVDGLFAGVSAALGD